MPEILANPRSSQRTPVNALESHVLPVAEFTQNRASVAKLT